MEGGDYDNCIEKKQKILSIILIKLICDGPTTLLLNVKKNNDFFIISVKSL